MTKNSDKHIRIEVPKDGTIPDVTGSKAVSMQVHNRVKPDGTMQIRLLLDAIGDDALHAGSIKVQVTLTPSPFVENSPLSEIEQANIGAEYMHLMIESAQGYIGENLMSLVDETIGEQVLGSETLDETATNLMGIAHTLLHVTGGNKDMAKTLASKDNPALVACIPEGSPPETLDLAVTAIHMAIDTATVGSD